MATGSGRLEGTVFYRERMMLPPGATITVQLEDISRADAMADVLASSVMAARGGPPYPFVLEYEPARIDPRMHYALRATIADAGRMLFTTTDYVDPFGEQPLDLMVVRVAEPVDQPAPALEGVRWLLHTLRGEPAPPGAGGEPLDIQFQAGERRAGGFSGCNRFSGGYQREGDSRFGAPLRFSPLAATLRACAEGMEAERAYLAALGEVTAFRLEGGTLTLLAGPDVMATFRLE